MVAALGGPSEVVVPVSILVVPLLIHGLGGFALLAAGSGSRGSLRLGWLLASSCLATLVGAAPVFRAFDTVKSPRAAVELAMDRLDELRAGGAEPVYAVYFVDRADDRDVPSWTGTAPFVYYARGAARRPAIFRGVAAVRDALAPGKPPCVLVMRQTYHQLLPLDVRERLHPRFQKETGSRTLVVVDSAP
jgi:hypothetical protein